MKFRRSHHALRGGHSLHLIGCYPRERAAGRPQPGAGGSVLPFVFVEDLFCLVDQVIVELARQSDIVGVDIEFAELPDQVL